MQRPRGGSLPGVFRDKLGTLYGWSRVNGGGWQLTVAAITDETKPGSYEIYKMCTLGSSSCSLLTGLLCTRLQPITTNLVHALFLPRNPMEPYML